MSDFRDLYIVFFFFFLSKKPHFYSPTPPTKKSRRRQTFLLDISAEAKMNMDALMASIIAVGQSENPAETARNEASKNRLLKACEKGDEKEVHRWCMDHRYNEHRSSLLNAPDDEHGLTPLHHASMSGHEKVVSVLLEANANMESKDKYGYTPLHYASMNGKEKVVKILLQVNANIDAIDHDGLKPGEFFRSWVSESKKPQIQEMLNEERDRRNKPQHWQQTSAPVLPPRPVSPVSQPSPPSQTSAPVLPPRPSSPVSQPPPPSQTQEAERIGKIKCKYNGDAIRFTLKKTTTLGELMATVEGQWGEGKGVKFQDEDGDWIIMNTNDDVVEVWEQTKKGVVSLEVFSTQQNQTSLSTLPTSSSALSTSSSCTNAPPVFVKKRFPETKYKELYDPTAPKFSFEVFNAVKTFIEIYGKQESIPDADVDRFIGELHHETTVLGGVDELIDEIGTIATRLWTSAKTLNNRELCSIFNQAIRDDNEAMMPAVVMFARGINLLCVTRNLMIQKPEKTYRGGALPPQHHSFFEVGKQFRTAQFLSTSKNRQVAIDFAYKASERGEEPIVWEFVFHPDFGCKHVNFLQKSNVEGEQEFLFTAYSVFTVRSREIKSLPNWMDPHKIVLEVAPDNRLYPEDLPLSPWS